MMFLKIGYTDIEKLYQANKFNDLFLFVYGAAMIFALFITLFKFGKQIKANSIDKPITIQALFELLLPFLPYYLLLTAMPLLSGIFESFTAFMVDTVPNAVPSNGFSDLDQPMADYLKAQKDDIKTWSVLSMEFKNPFKSFSLWLEEMALNIISPIAHYLYAFALTVYFMWLLVLEAFAPIAFLGLVFY